METSSTLKRRRSSRDGSEVISDVVSKIDEKFKVAVVDYKSPDAAQQFTDSLKTTGFAVLTNHPISNTLIQDVYSEWREFMIKLHGDALTTDFCPKPDSVHGGTACEDGARTNLAEKYYRELQTQAGYFPMAGAETAKGAKYRDLKHYFQCYFPSPDRYPSEVSDGAHKLWSDLIGLGKVLVQWIDDHMPSEVKRTIQQKIGEETRLVDCVSDERTMLRVLHYPGYASSEQEAGAVRAAAHEDINLITVLPAGSARGLQVKSNQSGEWVEVPLVEGSIVINIGDMMQEMSDGAYVSTTHRVIKMDEDPQEAGATTRGGGAGGASGGEGEGEGKLPSIFGTNDRMSTPCFIHLKQKCPLSSNYGSAEHYLLDRLVTLGVKPKAALDEFLSEHPGGSLAGWDPATE